MREKEDWLNRTDGYVKLFYAYREVKRYRDKFRELHVTGRLDERVGVCFLGDFIVGPRCD
jgi:hypothetical protein